MTFFHIIQKCFLILSPGQGNKKKKTFPKPFVLRSIILGIPFLLGGLVPAHDLDLPKESSSTSHKKEQRTPKIPKKDISKKKKKEGEKPDIPPTQNQKNITESIKSQVTAWSQSINTSKEMPLSTLITAQSKPLPNSSNQQIPDEPPKKILTSLTARLNTDSTLKIDLHFKLGTPFFSVFSRDSIWYIVLSHPSDFEKNAYDPNELINLEKITTLDIEGGLVIKVALNKRLFPIIKYDEKADTIRLSFSPTQPLENRHQDILLPKENNPSFRVHQNNGRLDLHFYDDDQAHLWVICASGENEPLHAHNYPEFNLLESYQGLAFELNNDEIITRFLNKIATLTKPDGLAVSLERTKDESKEKKNFLFKDFDIKDAPEKISNLTKIATVQSNPIQEYFEMIFLYIGQGKLPEAIAIINRLREMSLDLELVPAFTALEGLCQLSLGRHEKAEKILTPLCSNIETQFWSKLAQASKNLCMPPIEPHHLSTYKNSLLSMPLNLQESLLIKILSLGINQRDAPILREFTCPQLKPKNERALVYYKLASIINRSKESPNSKFNQQNKKELAFLKQNATDPQIPVIIDFELLKNDPTPSDQDPSSEFKQLDELCYKWRGDILEYKINTYLANRYMERKKYQFSLPIYRRMIKHFETIAHEDNLHQKMKDALVAYFKQDPFPPILEALSVFQEYGDNAPNNQDGDDMILRATNPLIQLDLYDEAISIIKNYMEKMIKAGNDTDTSTGENRKNALLYRMGVIHFLNNNPKLSLELLSQIKGENPDLHQEINLLKAECYNDLKNLESALNVLGDTPHELLRKGALYFTHEKWPEAAETFQRILTLRGKNSDAVPLEMAQTVLIDLGICYASLKQVENLKDLKTHYSSLIENSKYYSSFEFLTSDLSFDNIHELSGSKLSEVGQVTNYADNLKKIFSKNN